MAREERYENCLKNLGWTKNKKEAFPNDDLLLDAPTITADTVKPNFYKLTKRSKKTSVICRSSGPKPFGSSL